MNRTEIRYLSGTTFEGGVLSNGEFVFLHELCWKYKDGRLACGVRPVFVFPIPLDKLRSLCDGLLFIESHPKETQYPTRSRKANTHAVVENASGVQVGEGSKEQCKKLIKSSHHIWHIVQLTD